MTGREDVYQKVMNDGHSAAWDQMWDKAAVYYQMALEEFPNQPKALSSLGLALLQLQRFDESLQIYRRVLEITPEDPIPAEKVAQLSERLGSLQDAIRSTMRAAELYLNQRDIDKAIENWVRVTQLDSDHIQAHTRLAMAYEKMGRTGQAVNEYLVVASLVQRSGHIDKAAELVDKALVLSPNSQEVKQAQALLKSNQLLPKPPRSKGGTGALRMAQVRQLETPTQQAETGLDPIAETRQKALTRLAEVLFEYSSDDDGKQVPRGIRAIVRGTGPLSLGQSERSRVILHLSQAIEALTKNQETQAVDELERALEAGFNHPALYFNLGLLRSKGDRLESALRHLQQAVKHKNYALGAHLLMGDIQRKIRRLPEAAQEYLESLKLADSMVVSPDQSDGIRQLYEPLIEAQANQKDETALNRLCDNIHDLLVSPNWRDKVLKAREQLPAPLGGELPFPLAEILIKAESSQVLETITRVHQLARDGQVRAAMEEAFHGLKHTPTYLPLHTLIGDLLIQEGRIQDAVTKFMVVANAYRTRGEAAQATALLRRIIQVAPMDMTIRSSLIKQLEASGQEDAAINEYLDLGELYYQQADLEMARKTYTAALHQAQQGNVDRVWNVKILQRMADIDMQRLDWRQAIRVFEQIRTLQPDDVEARKYLVDLNLGLDQQSQAMTELDSYLSCLESNNRSMDGIPFLEDLLKDHADQVGLQRALAEQYRRVGRIDEAVAQLDALGEALLEAGNKEGAIEAITLILSMNPPNVDDYRKLLRKIQTG
jgi:tetratricopeptide (TPR) repeat protein